MRNAIALFASSVLVVMAAALPGRPAPMPQTHLSVTDIYTPPVRSRSSLRPEAVAGSEVR